ncbi:hypothetical protein B0T24DRAFT_642337 [Lasiosphaeria ovina]|uniref:Uncharacterized protein n=1 Tax=Lasiosphaeria ovina TaxID=92902 RepID=A0AAE0JTA6_9PEZI|nr:hypothetical protein B0T24DRAFT_642337 [Lasiosphaeria ovina]
MATIDYEEIHKPHSPRRTSIESPRQTWTYEGSSGALRLMEETDAQTFNRFSQFASTGDYYGAEPSNGHEEEGRVSDRDNAMADWGDCGGKKRCSLRKVRRILPGIGSRSSTQTQNLPAEKPKRRLHRGISSHARLYVFADYHGIGNLKAHSLRKLHRILVRFILYERRVGDIVP